MSGEARKAQKAERKQRRDHVKKLGQYPLEKCKAIWEQEFQKAGGCFLWSGMWERIRKMTYLTMLLPIILLFIFFDSGWLLSFLSTLTLPFIFISLIFDFLRVLSPKPDLIISDEGIEVLCTLHSLDKIFWNELLDTKCQYKESVPQLSFSDGLIIRMNPETISAHRRRPKPWRYLHWAEPRFRARYDLPIMGTSRVDFPRMQFAVEYYYKRWQKRQKQGAE